MSPRMTWKEYKENRELYAPEPMDRVERLLLWVDWLFTYNVKI
jgi:hypothetical protein